MLEIPFKWLLEASKGLLKNQGVSEFIKGISIDSRSIQPKECFVAIEGEVFDGHSFIKDCLSKGVRTFIVRNGFFYRNSRMFIEHQASVIEVRDTRKVLMTLAARYRSDFVSDKEFVAITGSSGKTTTKYFIAQLLSYKYNVIYSPKSYNNDIGLPISIFLTDEKTDIGIFEMGMNRKCEISKLSRFTKPDVGVITNIGYAHIGNLKSQRNIAFAKSEIMDGMSKGGVVFINKNTNYVNVLVSKAKNKELEVIFFDLGDIEIIEDRGIDGFILRYKGNTLFFPVPGIQNVENLACAFNIAEFFGVDIKDTVEIVSNLSTPEMRSSIIQGRVTLIDDSYNANPDSMKMALDLLDKASCKGKKIALLGDMLELGGFSNNLHLEIGNYILTKNIGYLLLYGEKFSQIYDFLVQNGRNKNNTFVVSSITEIAEILSYIVEDGDIILVKASRGMRLNEISEFLRVKFKEEVL